MEDTLKMPQSRSTTSRGPKRRRDEEEQTHHETTDAQTKNRLETVSSKTSGCWVGEGVGWGGVVVGGEGMEYFMSSNMLFYVANVLQPLVNLNTVFWTIESKQLKCAQSLFIIYTIMNKTYKRLPLVRGNFCGRHTALIQPW